MAGKGYINKINPVEILHQSKAFGYAMNASAQIWLRHISLWSV